MQRVILSFSPKWKKKNKNGESPIYLRITINGYRTELSTGVSIKPEIWNHKSHHLKNSKDQYLTLKGYLDNFKTKVYEKIMQGTIDKQEITPKFIKELLDHGDRTKKTLLNNYELFLKECDFLVQQKKRKLSTYKKYVDVGNKIKEFIEKQIHKKDVLLMDLDYEFIKRFDFFLMSEYGSKHNTRVKLMKSLKCIAHYNMNNSQVPFNPFKGYATTFKSDGVKYLTSEEVKKIEDKTFNNPRLEQIKDVFLFLCYTGFAFCDICLLKHEDVIEFNGIKCIDTQRFKTSVPCFVPLCNKALKIYEKYKDMCTNQILPLKSNQKVNDYLKEIGDLSGINKSLTSHFGRHTFGHIAQENGIPLEVIKNVLGHTNTKMTAQYCKMDKTQIIDQMKKLNTSSDHKKESHE
jgi:site-specific recombinase XerD